MTLQDRLCTGLLAAALVALAAFWAPAYIPPALWERIAVAAGLRPPQALYPALWQSIVEIPLRHLPMDTALKVLAWAGHLSLGAIACLAASIMMRLMPSILRAQLAEARSRRLMLWFVILPATALFCMSDPVWRLGLFFSPATLQVLLALVATLGIVKFVRTLETAPILVSFALLGVIGAETPGGFVFAVAGLATVRIVGVMRGNDPGVNPLADRTVITMVQRATTLEFAAAFTAVTVLNVLFFAWHDGFAALDVDGLDCLLDYFKIALGIVRGSATGGGWMFGVATVALPFVMAVALLRQAVDYERVLPYWCALIYSMTGIISWLQLAGWKSFWFWNFEKSYDTVASPLLLCTAMALSTLTLAYTFCVLATEIHYRRYNRLAGSLVEAMVTDSIIKAPVPPLPAWMRSAFIVLPFALVVCSVWLRRMPVERAMQSIVGEFAALAARDCGDTPLVITDGSCDAAIEIEAARLGRRRGSFKAISIMSGSSPRDKYLRLRHEVPESEDAAALGVGTASTLRDWVREKSPRADLLAAQIGFEMWRHLKMPLPPMGGTGARTGGFPQEERDRSVGQAKRLAERILELSGRGAPDCIADRELRRVYNFVTWRIARIARMRADAADAAGDSAAALAETELADKLDEKNPAYASVRRKNDWIPQQVNKRFTPREGLKFALERADFTLARSFAAQVLNSDPDDVRANFAMGMSFVVKEQYARAAEYLERCLKRAPNEPAALNNLATVEMHLGRLEKAEEHALRAFKMMPNSPEVKRTFDRICRRLKEIREAKNLEQPR